MSLVEPKKNHMRVTRDFCVSCLENILGITKQQSEPAHLSAEIGSDQAVVMAPVHHFASLFDIARFSRLWH